MKVFSMGIILRQALQRIHEPKVHTFLLFYNENEAYYRMLILRLIKYALPPPRPLRLKMRPSDATAPFVWAGVFLHIPI